MNKNSYKEAISLLNSWAIAYYQGSPIATDDDYDVLYHEVLSYEEQNPREIISTSPSQTVNEGLVSSFDTESHEERMYSLRDVFSESEFLQWYENLSKNLHSKPELYTEKKFDGASLNLKYLNGRLVSALTRGNGLEGDVVTSHAMHIDGIPHSIPVDKSGEFIEIRGEVVILNDDFEIIQNELIANGEEPFKNSRNAAAGVLHSLDPSDCRKRKLTFLPYSIGSTSSDIKLGHTQIQRADFLVELGFRESMDRRYCQTPAQAISFYHEIMEKRDSLTMRIDGVVIKVNNITEQNVVGFNNKYPKWACAWKPPANEKKTILKDIEITVGKNGQLTPVGIVEPTEFNDATVSRVTFSNFDKIKNLDLRIGDHIVIIKSGDIIPKVLGVFKELRPEGAQRFSIPASCPSCGSPVNSRSNKDGSDTVALFCTGASCPSKAEGLLTYIISKPVLNVDGMGEKTAIQLVHKYKVNNVLDLLNVKVEEFGTLDGFAKKKAEKTFASVQSIIGNISYDKLLVLFNVDGLGKSISKELVTEYQLNVFNSSVMKDVKMHGTDSDVFERLCEYLNNNQEYISLLMDKLQPTELEIKESEWSSEVNHDGKFSGKTICITGTLDKPRSEYASVIESEGGTFVDKMKKNVDILVIGEKVGKTKIEKAEKMGITCIPFADFF